MRAQGLAAVGLLALLAGAVAWRPMPLLRPSPVPAARAEAWMADALPGIGPRRREAAAEAIQAWELDRLPPAARSAAASCFAPPQGRGPERRSTQPGSP